MVRLHSRNGDIVKSTYKNVGWPDSNLGYMQEVEDEIRKNHPSWDDDKVQKELLKVLKGLTICNAKNKQIKKIKKIKQIKKITPSKDK